MKQSPVTRATRSSIRFVYPKASFFLATTTSILTLILTLSHAHASTPPSPAERGGATPARFKAGDEAYRDRKTDASARRALEIYRKAFRSNPQDAEAGWRLAMVCYFVGIRLTTDSNAKKELFREGREAGLLAIQNDKECAACHFWTAINMSLYGQTVGALKMLVSLNEIQDHLQTSLSIDPTYAFGGAYRLLGLIRQKLPGVLGGNNQRARGYFERAIDAVPDEPLNYLFLAKLLKNEMGMKAQAIEVAQKGLALKGPLAPDRMESLEAREELKEFLKQEE